MKQSDKLKELLEEVHKLAEESLLYLPIIESLDYEEKEPLIDDKKIRSAVSKWFDSLERESVTVTYRYAEDCLVYNEISDLTDTARSEVKISFNSWSAFKNLEDGKSYTRAELCGEEE